MMFGCLKHQCVSYFWLLLRNLSSYNSPKTMSSTHLELNTYNYFCRQSLAKAIKSTCTKSASSTFDQHITNFHQSSAMKKHNNTTNTHKETPKQPTTPKRITRSTAAQQDTQHQLELQPKKRNQSKKKEESYSSSEESNHKEIPEKKRGRGQRKGTSPSETPKRRHRGKNESLPKNAAKKKESSPTKPQLPIQDEIVIEVQPEIVVEQEIVEQKAEERRREAINFNALPSQEKQDILNKVYLGAERRNARSFTTISQYKKILTEARGCPNEREEADDRVIDHLWRSNRLLPVMTQKIGRQMARDVQMEEQECVHFYQDRTLLAKKRRSQILSDHLAYREKVRFQMKKERQEIRELQMAMKHSQAPNAKTEENIHVQEKDVTFDRILVANLPQIRAREEVLAAVASQSNENRPLFLGQRNEGESQGTAQSLVSGPEFQVNSPQKRPAQAMLPASSKIEISQSQQAYQSSQVAQFGVSYQETVPQKRQVEPETQWQEPVQIKKKEVFNKPKRHRVSDRRMELEYRMSRKRIQILHRYHQNPFEARHHNKDLGQLWKKLMGAEFEDLASYFTVLPRPMSASQQYNFQRPSITIMPQDFYIPTSYRPDVPKLSKNMSSEAFDWRRKQVEELRVLFDNWKERQQITKFLALIQKAKDEVNYPRSQKRKLQPRNQEMVPEATEVQEFAQSQETIDVPETTKIQEMTVQDRIDFQGENEEEFLQ